MSELLPTRQAWDLRRAVTEYVTTAVSLSDSAVDAALQEFLTHDQRGIFLGPYLRTRLPFTGDDSAGGEVPPLDVLPEWFTPYAHQARAFRRLTTNPAIHGAQDEQGMRLPDPTIVTTGTGSGKTEAFLWPVLDHAARARAAGIGGIKALILYPMNALANDQAGRLAELLATNPRLRGITAALYTGEASQTPRTQVSADGLITDREIIRGEAPDILLTNYKMLDQLLLRAADRPLWDTSARSLRYLVLDEFHTYDGAQGTDVAMLLRRLRLVLERRAPGKVHITPVATSATLGDDADPGQMLAFARTVFGTGFDPDSVVTESRIDLDTFTHLATTRISNALEHDGTVDLTPRTVPLDLMRELRRTHLGITGGTTSPEHITTDVLDALWEATRTTDEEAVDLSAGAAATALGISEADLLIAHPTIITLLARTSREATPLADLAREAYPGVLDDSAARAFITLALAALSHLRALAGRNEFPSLEAHLWIREVSRIDRAVTTTPTFQWSDLPEADDDRALPAVYCRHCGRSGWGVSLASIGDTLDTRPHRIRQDQVRRTGRFRALVLDTSTTGAPADESRRSSRRWLDLPGEMLQSSPPGADDLDADLIPVLVHTGPDAEDDSLADTCPACRGRDGIRFVGSRVATLLSVSLSSLFGTAGIDPSEKKALVFTDSVQDAAHRAGFVEARSHTLTLRAVTRSALDPTPAPISEVVERLLAAATTPEQKYRLLHPTIAGHDAVAPFSQPGASRAQRRKAEERVRKRLRFDLALEFGLTGQVGRTLSMTGNAAASVHITDEEIAAVTAPVLDGLRASGDMFAQEMPVDARVWVHGILERLRQRGAISHPWFDPFRKGGGQQYHLWGGRPERDVMPAFPRGRSLPGFPALGRRGPKSLLEDASARGSWYADWTARVLGLGDRNQAASLMRPLLQALVEHGILDAVTTRSAPEVTSYALIADRVLVRSRGDDDETTPVLTCRECTSVVTGTDDLLEALHGAPCTTFACPGRLETAAVPRSYYSRLYRSDMRRVIAREHTALVATPTRLDHERRFKARDPEPGAPNVLVATPTLEMGIDIGDLSTVMLASVPRTVASYLQRVGRAGRLTGNAFDVAFVGAPGRSTGVFTDPLDVLNGSVLAPGAYLSAEELLHRQFLAFLMDGLAGDDRIEPPSRNVPVLRSSEPGTYLGALLADVTQHGERRIEEFLSGFENAEEPWAGLTTDAATALRTWVTDRSKGSTGLEKTVHGAVQRWNTARESLIRRRHAIERNLRDLDADAAAHADSIEVRAQLEAEKNLLDIQVDDLDGADGTRAGADPAEVEKDRRRLRSSAGRIRAEVSTVDTAHWIAVLERFGLLPNFTLVDDGVTLEATLIWQTDDGAWRHSGVAYDRGGSSALTEFAPGAHFYAEGNELVIDTVDLGTDGSGIVRTAFCPACGTTVRIEGTPPVACPACHAPQIADAGQHLEVVDLQRVYSTMMRNRALITDQDEERQRLHFEQALTVHLEGAETRASWAVAGKGLGFAFHRGAHITRLNLGRPLDAADETVLSGETRKVGGFLLCAECGHLDSDTAGNQPKDHQAWCSKRYAAEADNKKVVLARSISTEVVVISLPSSLAEAGTDIDLFSLRAAIMLGLATRFGGTVGHIQADLISAPGHVSRRALLLSDTVPGGTGYLAELSTPATVWAVLTEALRVLTDCPCGDGSAAACHRCLLPYVPSSARESTSRQRAEEILQEILGTEAPEPDQPDWEVTEGEGTGEDDFESSLEKRFRRVFHRAVAALPGASVEARSSDGGEVLSIRHDGRTFTLKPQVTIGGTRPDFVLTWQGADVAGIAVYTDGREYHASTTHNRLADDAAKRAALREQGYLVIGVTHADLDRFEKMQEGTARVEPPPMIDLNVLDFAEAQHQISPEMRDLVLGTAVDQVLAVIRDGGTSAHRTVAQLLSRFLVNREDVALIDPAEAVDDLARFLDDGHRKPFTERSGANLSRGVLRRLGALVALADFAPGGTVTLMLDDRDTAVASDDFVEAWQGWLRLSNLRQGAALGVGLEATTWTRARNAMRSDYTPLDSTLDLGPGRDTPDAPSAGQGTDGAADVDDDLPSDWQQLVEDAYTNEERSVLIQAALADVPLPVVGEEQGSAGVIVDIAWPDRKKGVVLDVLRPEDQASLEAEGWTILGPDIDGVIERLGLN
ncbi:DEAD/DEAH box helicase [Brachybacterium sp. p3-SID957]|uniref:DEAD/DEAH box helicase n=1 Tax=Brachybacterium sp. p3-SID957 TaxID=2916049 RepID=UPI0028834C66|nr:DEAD/DEAH box helicase [Brachybacterium sp. p3-SID957]